MRFSFIVLIIFCLSVLNDCYGQQDKEISSVDADQDSVSSLIMSADEVYYSLTEEGQEIDTLINNVVLIQDSVYMSCSYAIVKNQIQAFATGDIVIVHKDSTIIYADTLRYNGLLKKAILTGEVILDSKGKRLNTDRLLYDLKTENASFNTGAKLIDDISTLDALYGIYDVSTEQAVFKHNVRYQDTSMTVIADSIQYDYYKNQIRFLSPTNIYQDSTTIYTESGVYDTRMEKGILSQNVQINTKDKIIKAGLLIYDGKSEEYKMYLDPSITELDGSVASGDSIYYSADQDLLRLMRNANYVSSEQSVEADEIVYDLKNDLYTTVGESQVVDKGSTIVADTILKTEEGQTLAMGLVTLRDTSSGTTIFCDLIESTDYGHKAYSISGQPMLIYELGNSDSLFLRADTLLTEQGDSLDLFIADQNVSLMKGDIRGRSNSMVYDKLDSIITLYIDPIMWSDSTQLTADTILITMKSGDIDGLNLINDAFIVEIDSDAGFNQVNGDRINCDIGGQILQSAEVVSSAQMIYFIRDENELLKGINKTLSSSMLFSFSDNEIDNVYFYKKPESEITEYQEGMDLSTFILEGVEWRLNEKPDFSIFVHPNLTLAR